MRQAIETERLRLEPTKGEYAGALWHAIERSLPELKKWMSWASSSTPQTSAEYAHRAEAGWSDGTNWDWTVFFGEEVAGTVGLNRYDELWRSCNLGYWIRSDLAGGGLATEASRAVVDFAFEQIGLNRLELVADVDNAASIRVAQKLGFRHEGIKREGAFVDGRGVDVHMFGLIASDPRPWD
jgi:ribosomal-protein-serine acetyltransferase